MTTYEYSRPDDRELLRASLRSLFAAFRPAVLFGGMVDGASLRLSEFLGTDTASLQKVRVEPGTGLGGRVLSQGRPLLVQDYVGSEAITHEYDRVVRHERLRSMAAAPVVVRGKTRSVLYIAVRGEAPLGERVISEAMSAAAAMAAEMNIRDEVDRRLAIMAEARVQPELSFESTWMEHVRQAHADLRSLASRVEDAELSAQLQRIGGFLMPAPSAPVAVQSLLRLTPRELDVLAQMALGCSYEETAARLALKPVTVKSYMQNAMMKLSVHNRVEAVSAARKLGLLP
ncbi:LuxR C-terminal-related transcriptional regulator [Arthrobacter sp. ISL-5]|uniref:helix-turn-helix transcriptional regulator n=1 Tax=Arthrobacter sp. ISL-5 TaxID=2819111 RepID=UPI001BEC8821|nr:LuxR C-terminal-related transcriptional regulator [Arthrobacter sp. ISL-5]MBT2551754.1 helix-turn-helix transcriptional regulator [Arthrobacter sp. ISL-5]